MHAPVKFCPNCGQAFANVSPAAAPGIVALTPPQTKKWVWPVVAILAICIGLGVAAGSGMLRAWGVPVGGKLLTAQGTPGGSGLVQAEGAEPNTGLLNKYGTPPESGLTQKDMEKITMPQDILDYLKHVEKCEKYRVEISNKQLSSALITMTEIQGAGAQLEMIKKLADPEDNSTETPASKIKDTTKDQRKTWDELDAYFNGVTPPAECVSIRNKYAVALHETGVMMTEIMDAIDKSSEDPQAAIEILQKLTGTSGNRIDVPARGTDADVQKICDKYDTRKWFSVTGDVGSGGLMGKGYGQ